MDVREASAAYAELSASPVDSLRPGYRHTEVGVIPDDWGASIIGALANTSSGTTPPRSMSERYFDRGDIPWVKTLDLNNSEIRVTDEKVTAAALSETSLQVYPAGSVLVAMYGGYNQIGRAGLLRVAAAVNQALTAIVPNDRVLDSTYLLHMLNYRVDYWRVVASSSRKDPNITGKDVAQFPLALPSIREQQAIAEALSDADALIESLEQLIAKKRQIKQGTMQALLTGKQRLPGFASNWVSKSLSDLSSIRSGGTPSTTQSQFWDGDILWCTPTDITGLKGKKYLSDTNRKITVQGLQSSSAELIPANSIVMTSRATIGECAINVTPVATNQGFKNFIPFDDVDVEFLYYLLLMQTEGFIRLCAGSTFLEIGKTQLALFEVLTPPTKAEQTAIATILTDMDTELAELETRLAKTRQLKQGMMQELLTGRIRLV